MTRPLDEEAIRTELIKYSLKLYERGLVCASGGNASLHRDQTIWITRTGSTLGGLCEQDIVKVNLNGTILKGGIPSKELGMHLAMYRARPEAEAVIHAHPTYCVAYSALQPGPSPNSIRPYTAAFYVRAGRVPMVGYYHSGSSSLHAAVARLAPHYGAILLQNHGLVVAAVDMLTAFNIAEEVEETCKIAMLAGPDANMLTPQQCEEIDAKLGRAWAKAELS